MAGGTLRDRLNKDKPFYFSWLTAPGAVMAGQIARLPFDGVCIDMQHGLADFDDAVAMVPAIHAVGKPAIIRVLWNDPGLVGQALDVGAQVIIAPMVNTAAEAAKLVKAAKYPPVGMRSWGGYAAVQASGKAAADYLAEANRLTLVFAMIETQEALDNLNAIAKTPGLDGLFVGPNDLGISLGLGLNADLKIPKLEKALGKIMAAARANKLVPGVFGGSPAACKQYVSLGFRFMPAATDVAMLVAGAKAMDPR